MVVKKITDYTAGSNEMIMWVLHYDDSKTGKHFDFVWPATIHSRTQGNGCPYLKASKLEQLSYHIVKKMKLKFIAEHTFGECKDRQLLKFDVYLTQKNKIIELDGIQHFGIVDFHGVKKEKELLEELELRQNHNIIKDNFCSNNNIPLLRIPYIYDAKKDKKEITKIIQDFVKYGIVPIKIKEFYESEGRTSYISLLSKMSNENEILVA